MADFNKQKVSKLANWLTIVVALVVLCVTGAIYRLVVSEMKIAVNTHIRLPLSLSTIPQQIGTWTGTDIPISETIQEVAGNDDFLNRVYIDKQTNQSANIYLGYSARPRTMVGHKPSVCYPANGWIYEEHRVSEFVSSGGRRISCVINKFHKPLPEIREVFVLNYYIINGRITIKEEDFSGFGWRTPNINGNLALYAAQIQISSTSEKSSLDLAEDITDSLLAFLPDESGHVKAAEFKDIGNVPK
jgi:hypothetical protein